MVPLSVDAEGLPHFRALDGATVDIGRGLHPDTLVSDQTTLRVGTTSERWKPMLEGISEPREGPDFSVVYSPERVLRDSSDELNLARAYPG